MEMRRKQPIGVELVRRGVVRSRYRKSLRISKKKSKNEIGRHFI